MKIHLDTDIGGNIDDLCALAMLLRWPGLELTGITTVADNAGQRAGYVRHVLRLEHREEIPVAAGADVSLGCYRGEPVFQDEATYWGERIAPAPNPASEALLLLKQSIEQGAVVVGIGPFTNLALLESRYPGMLGQAPLFLMGGFIYPVREGYPQRDNRSDYNVQVDAGSARLIIEHCSPTLVPLPLTVETALRRSYLGALRQAGALGQLLARQAEAFACDHNLAARYETCSRVPSDLISFLHDPLTCAIAAGWREGVEISEILLKLESRDGWLDETVDPEGKPVRVVTRIDADRFDEFWLETVSRRDAAKS